MIHMSPAQFQLLQGRSRPQQPRARQIRAKKRKQDLPENILVAQIKSFLEARGWTVTRQQTGLFTRPGVDRSQAQTGQLVYVGQKGMADWRAERPLRGVGVPGACQLFYFETKAPGKRPKPHQQQWLETRAACGFLAAWFDDFSGDWDTSFLPWYRARFGD